MMRTSFMERNRGYNLQNSQANAVMVASSSDSRRIIKVSINMNVGTVFVRMLIDQPSVKQVTSICFRFPSFIAPH